MPNILLTCKPLESKKGPHYIELSLEDYLKTLPQYKNSWTTRALFKLASIFNSQSFIENYLITYADYKGLVDLAKETQFGLVILKIGTYKIIFTANTSIQDELVSLEAKPENPYTSRLLVTNQNKRLLENNPVSVNHIDPESNYVEQQRAFFSSIAQNTDFVTFVESVFPTTAERACISGEEAMRRIEVAFTQLYFQALFKSQEGETLVDERIAKNVQNHYSKIRNLYLEIERCTGKHDLTFGRFIEMSANADVSKDISDRKLIPMLYEIMCAIYDEKPIIDPLLNEQDIAKNIVALMKKYKSAVLPIFDKLPDDTNRCFNLLSWLDNSLNIINTLTNCIMHIHDTKPKAKQTHLENQYIWKLLPSMRALSTLFLRKVNQDHAITLAFEGNQEQITLDDHARFMMTNSINGGVFGTNPRKCPSRDFSFQVIPTFIKAFFKRLHIDHALNQSQSLPKLQSWFWNIVSPQSKQLDVLLKSLEQYIKRIESHSPISKKPGESSNRIDFEHGFWHHRQSRAINREGNYLLAKALKRMLIETRTLDEIYGDTSIDKRPSLNVALLAYRKQLMLNDSQLKLKPCFDVAIGRVINSHELNQAILGIS